MDMGCSFGHSGLLAPGVSLMLTNTCCGSGHVVFSPCINDLKLR